MATATPPTAAAPPIITQPVVAELFIRGMESLRHLLVKGTLAPNAAALPSARLYEDMLPLTFQVYACCDASLCAVEKLAGASVPRWPGDDATKTLGGLIAAVDAALAALRAVDDASLDRADHHGVVHYEIGGYGPIDLPVKNWLLGWSLPMFMFHLVTAYDILRNKGVTLGKKDYMAFFLDPWTESLRGHLNAHLAEDVEAKAARDKKHGKEGDAVLANGTAKVNGDE